MGILEASDDRHPGLPVVQAAALQRALAAGIRLMRGQNWLGLPRPQQVEDPTLFVREDRGVAQEREQRQLDVSALIDARGVGKAAFDAADGWNTRTRDAVAAKKLSKACAEWADGELVGAHIAYQNDVLCTNDRARGAGTSIFNATNRSWLTAEFGVRFMTTDELAAKIAE
ncbi:MAG: hypothetical protein JWL84_5997 [Rhodospirillales bacterium]|nr:hypothetical protein [Rhodospirillales bacterium]